MEGIFLIKLSKDGSNNKGLGERRFGEKEKVDLWEVFMYEENWWEVRW